MNLKNLRLILVGLGVLAILAFTLVFLFRQPIKSFVNSIRAERLQTQAQMAFEQEHWAEAARIGQAAYYLDKDNTDVQMIVARSLLKLRAWSAIAWWNMILDEPDVPVEELREMTGALLEGRFVEEALPLLTRLMQLDPDNPETKRLWLRSLEVQHRYRKALSVAGSMAQPDVNDWSIHQAYMTMQRNLAQDEGMERVIEHLQRLLNDDGPLALNAARQLLFSQKADFDTREASAVYIQEHSDSAIDLLAAASFEVKEGLQDRSVLDPLLNEILEDPDPGQLEDLLEWARWMNAADWFFTNVDWETYRRNKGEPDAYFNLLMEEGRFDRVLEMTETSATQGEADMSTFLYYRSLALARVGEEERSRGTLELAVQTVDPDQPEKLERFLVRDGQWEMLSSLYDIVLENDPANNSYLMKALAARYYSGDQDSMPSLLSRVDVDLLNSTPDMQGFYLYLRLLAEGYSNDVHKDLEKLVTRYPELFDFRVILGVSYTLQGRGELASQLLQGMPPLSNTAPRYIRIAAIIAGERNRELLLAGEMEHLLPRERYLVSLRLE